MTLFYDLPSWVTDLVAEGYKDETIKYAVPWDLNENDEFIDGYFVVTDKNMLVLEKGVIKKEIVIDAFNDFKVTSLNGAGIIEAKAVECLGANDPYLIIILLTLSTINKLPFSVI